MSRRQSLQDGTGIVADDGDNNAIMAVGVTVPSDGTKGFATGCIFLDLDSTTTGQQFYVNEGTNTSCAFHPLTGLLSSSLIVASGASLTIGPSHHGKIIVLAASAAITLPATTGSGLDVQFVVGTTSTAVTITAAGAHLYGTLNQNNDTAQGTGFQLPAILAGPSTTITLDGSTKGGAVGDWVHLTDIATNKWWCRGQLAASGTEASPFS